MRTCNHDCSHVSLAQKRNLHHEVRSIKNAQSPTAWVFEPFTMTRTFPLRSYWTGTGALPLPPGVENLTHTHTHAITNTAALAHSHLLPPSPFSRWHTASFFMALDGQTGFFEPQERPHEKISGHLSRKVRNSEATLTTLRNLFLLRDDPSLATVKLLFTCWCLSLLAGSGSFRQPGGLAPASGSTSPKDLKLP